MIDTYIFIGMAGVGKSSIGSVIAKHFNLKFYDVDTYIINKYNQSLNQLIDELGPEKFKQIESESVLDLVGNQHVIAPGGSFIYSLDVINLIKDRTLFILLHDNPINIKNRINNIDTRGIIGMENNSFEEIFYQRQGLYQNVCDLRFNLEFQSFKSVCNNIISYLDLLI